MANPDHLAKFKEGVEAWNEWRDGDSRDRANLSDSEAYLSEADLRGADLRGARLIAAYLIAAYLSEADLSGANLRGAGLIAADLIAAGLIAADLSGANLSGARVAGTKFAKMIGERNQWCRVDLSETVDLGSIWHRGPSSIGTDTLAKSKGRIPGAFLRGCGLSDWEIENAKLHNPDLSGRPP